MLKERRADGLITVGSVVRERSRRNLTDPRIGSGVQQTRKAPTGLSHRSREKRHGWRARQAWQPVTSGNRSGVHHSPSAAEAAPRGSLRTARSGIRAGEPGRADVDEGAPQTSQHSWPVMRAGHALWKPQERKVASRRHRNGVRSVWRACPAAKRRSSGPQAEANSRAPLENAAEVRDVRRTSSVFSHLFAPRTPEPDVDGRQVNVLEGASKVRKGGLWTSSERKLCRPTERPLRDEPRRPAAADLCRELERSRRSSSEGQRAAARRDKL
jgi:hypothetical protein